MVTPLSNSAICGTVTNADVLEWDSIGFPDGITNLAVYLLSGDATWSEDCTGPPPTGGVSPTFCDEPGSSIQLGILDPEVGTYGFQLILQYSARPHFRPSEKDGHSTLTFIFGLF